MPIDRWVECTWLGVFVFPFTDFVSLSPSRFISFLTLFLCNRFVSSCFSCLCSCYFVFIIYQFVHRWNESFVWMSFSFSFPFFLFPFLLSKSAAVPPLCVPLCALRFLSFSSCGDPNKDRFATDCRQFLSLALQLRAQRMAQGALTLASPSVSFVRDPTTRFPLEIGLWHKTLTGVFLFFSRLILSHVDLAFLPFLF